MLEGDWAWHSASHFLSFLEARGSRFQNWFFNLSRRKGRPLNRKPNPINAPMAGPRMSSSAPSEQPRTSPNAGRDLKPQPCSSAAHMAFAPRRPPIRDSSQVRGVRDDSVQLTACLGPGPEGASSSELRMSQRRRFPCRAISHAVCSAKALSLLELRCLHSLLGPSSKACPSPPHRGT